MPRRVWAGGVILLAGGCLTGTESATLVPGNPFITEACKPTEVRHIVEAPGTKEAADRVLAVGGKVIAANPQIGFRPRFSTIGAGARLQTRVSGPRLRCSIVGDSMCLPLSVSTETHVGHSAGGSLKLICDSTYSIVIRRHSRVAEGGACGVVSTVGGP